MAFGASHVACCIEGSRAQPMILDTGIRMLAPEGGTLSLVHAITNSAAMLAPAVPDISEHYDSTEEWLAETVRATQAAVDAAGIRATVQSVLLEGPPARSVVGWAEDASVELIVAAAHRGKVDRALLGSFASYVAYNAPCDVHLVRPDGLTHRGAAA